MQANIEKKLDQLINEATLVISKEKDYLLNTPIDLHDEIPSWGRDTAVFDQNIERNGFMNILFNLFRHFEANPSIKYKSDLITGSYVKEGETPHFLRWLQAANQGGINPSFYTMITQELSKSIYDLRNKNHTKHFFLLGPKGCGKTTFVNYFLTIKERELNQQCNSISVRINATQLSANCTIKDGLKSQLCKVVFNYYCMDAPTEGLIKESVDQRIFSLDALQTESGIKRELIDSFFSFFVDHNKEKIKVIPSEFNQVYNSLIRMLRKTYKIKFLFIIDNFDQLGIDPNDVNNYNRRIEELSNLLDDDDLNLGLYLIVLRVDSFWQIKSKFAFSVERSFTLSIPSIASIYKQRRDLLPWKSKIFNSRDDQKLYIDTFVRIVGSSFINSFEKDKYKILSLEESLNNLERYSTYNKRQIINVLRIFCEKGFKGENLIDYISNIINSENSNKDLSESLNFGYYRFFESLMLSEFGYCCRFQGYTINKNNQELEFNNRTEGPVEHNIIPNLYSFAFVKGKKQSFTPFLKIRILQCLKNASISGFISVEKLKYELNRIFKYNKSLIELACYELNNTNCISIGNYDSTFYEFSFSNSLVKITDRGKLILYTFPIKINYLSISYEDVPFPIEYQIRGTDNEKTLPIANYYNKPQFLIKNILLSTPRIIGLLKTIEKFESQAYVNSSKDDVIRYNESDFQIANYLEIDAKRSYNKILSSYLLKDENRHHLKQLQNELDKILK